MAAAAVGVVGAVAVTEHCNGWRCCCSCCNGCWGWVCCCCCIGCNGCCCWLGCCCCSCECWGWIDCCCCMGCSGCCCCCNGCCDSCCGWSCKGSSSCCKCCCCCSGLCRWESSPSALWAWSAPGAIWRMCSLRVSFSARNLITLRRLFSWVKCSSSSSPSESFKGWSLRILIVIPGRLELIGDECHREVLVGSSSAAGEGWAARGPWQDWPVGPHQCFFFAPGKLQPGQTPRERPMSLRIASINIRICRRVTSSVWNAKNSNKQQMYNGQ